MTTVTVGNEKKGITNLTLHEVDMIYSLAKIGDWSDAEIGRKYRISEADVGKVFNNYIGLRGMLERNPKLPLDLASQKARLAKHDQENEYPN
jgi:hypothetical protein